MLWLVSLTAVAVLLVAPISRAKAAHRRRHRHARHARKATPSPSRRLRRPDPRRPSDRWSSLRAVRERSKLRPARARRSWTPRKSTILPLGKFVLTNPMTTHRDRHAAALLPDGRMLIVGGVDTVLVPLVSFPGPAMPWILSSTEILDPRVGHFSSAAKMKRRAMSPPLPCSRTVKC